MIPCEHCDRPGTVWMDGKLVCFKHYEEFKCEGDKLEPLVNQTEQT